MANIYCLDKAALEEVLSPINETIAIGPPVGCDRMQVHEVEPLEKGKDTSLKENTNSNEPMVEDTTNLVNEESEKRTQGMNEQQPRENMHTIPRVEGSLYTCPICKQTRHPK